ncbi:MAG: hypothetical protein ACWGOX_05035 [Desulforhopalus sp.]
MTTVTAKSRQQMMMPGYRQVHCCASCCSINAAAWALGAIFSSRSY